MTEDVLTEGKMKGSPKGKKTGIVPTKPPPAPLSQEHILAKAKALADKHKQDILDAREALVQEAIEKGYDPSEWAIADNSDDIRAGHTLEYHCYMVKKNPTKL